MVDEWQKDRFARELEEVRGQIREVRSELNRLEAERTHRQTNELDPALESNFQTHQSRLSELRARHDDLANLVEGNVDAPTTPSLYDHIVTFVGDYK
jgi:septal ring factor EnvC (AmiA/AmiB activator)